MADTPKEPAGEVTKKQALNSLLAQMKNERTSFEPLWRELSDYILPKRTRFLTTDANRGDRRSTRILDCTATFAARTLQSGMHSGMTSPARPWFRLTTPDPDLTELASVKDWLHIVTQRMNTVFTKSNFYKVLPTVYGDLGTFATGAMGIFEDADTAIRCYDYPVGSYWIAADETGRIAVFAREYQMTVRNLVKMFVGKNTGLDNPAWENISIATQNHWKRGQFETWVKICHFIVPNENYDGVSKLAKSKRWYQCYYEFGSDSPQGDDHKYLREDGYDEFPIMAPRWETAGEDVYGTNCPGMIVLGDAKQLQHGEKRGLQGLDKSINPPMVGPTSMRNAKASIIPGEMTYADTREGQAGFRPAHEVRHDVLTPLERKQEQVRFRIRRGYHEDLFLMLSSQGFDINRDMTAREIDERHEEKFVVLGPALENVNDDLLSPAIDRTFAIMERAGLIPPPPAELEGADLKVEYISIMATAQKMVGIAGLERTANFVGVIAKTTGDNKVFDKFDADQAIDEYGEMTGVSPRVIVPDEKVAAIRKQRAKVEGAAQEAAMLKDASAAAKNLATSPMEGRNALTEMLRGAQGGAPPGIVPGAEPAEEESVAA